MGPEAHQREGTHCSVASDELGQEVERSDDESVLVEMHEHDDESPMPTDGRVKTRVTMNTGVAGHVCLKHFPSVKSEHTSAPEQFAVAKESRSWTWESGEFNSKQVKIIRRSIRFRIASLVNPSYP